MNNILNLKIYFYDSFVKKLLGLMFIKNKINYGILFKKTNSIHTFFCFQNIDVVMLDKNFKVLYLYNSLKPSKIITPKKNVYYTLELPNEYIVNHKITIGTILILTNLEK